MKSNDIGLLKIGNEADRVTVASILFKNGYEVKTVRKRKNGRSYEYYVGFRPINFDDGKGGDSNDED